MTDIEGVLDLPRGQPQTLDRVAEHLTELPELVYLGHGGPHSTRAGEAPQDRASCGAFWWVQGFLALLALSS